MKLLKLTTLKDLESKILNGSWQHRKEWGLTVLIGLDAWHVYKFTPMLLLH